MRARNVTSPLSNRRSSRLTGPRGEPFPLRRPMLNEMRWSFRIARVSGIDIRVHVTFALVVMLGADSAMSVYGASSAWFGVVLICSLFLCVTLHELGHSL